MLFYTAFKNQATSAPGGLEQIHSFWFNVLTEL